MAKKAIILYVFFINLPILLFADFQQFAPSPITALIDKDFPPSFVKEYEGPQFPNLSNDGSGWLLEEGIAIGYCFHWAQNNQIYEVKYGKFKDPNSALDAVKNEIDHTILPKNNSFRLISHIEPASFFGKRIGDYTVSWDNFEEKKRGNIDFKDSNKHFPIINFSLKSYAVSIKGYWRESNFSNEEKFNLKFIDQLAEMIEKKIKINLAIEDIEKKLMHSSEEMKIPILLETIATYKKLHLIGKYDFAEKQIQKFLNEIPKRHSKNGNNFNELKNQGEIILNSVIFLKKIAGKSIPTLKRER